MYAIRHFRSLVRDHNFRQYQVKNKALGNYEV